MARRRSIGTLGGLLAGLLVAVLVLWVRSFAAPAPAGRARPRLGHVPEDASAPLRTIAIHYAPAFDRVALPVWRQLFATLPASVEVQVVVAAPADFARFRGLLAEWGTPRPERFHAAAVGTEITTWSRDRFAALQGDAGGQAGGVLAPPRIEVPFAGRAGDWQAPYAIARALYRAEPRTADFLFEGGDLASSPRWLFVDANLAGRNVGRADASRAALERALAGLFRQEIVWLGERPGDVPEHHIMMYMVPLDDDTVAVGDVREGMALLRREAEAGGAGAAAVDADADVDGHARRFDHAAALLAARGFRVVRFPAVVLAGAGSYVTYTNALFDRDAGGRRVVYLPTYALPGLDGAAARRYRELGYEVRPIDVSLIYTLNGSLGCLVNVVQRG